MNRLTQKTLVFCLPTLAGGGMERVMSVLLNTYAENNPELNLHLVLYGPPLDDFYKIDERVRIHRFGKTFSSKPGKIFFALNSFMFLRRKFQELNPDAILAFGSRWICFVLAANLGLPYPVFTSDRGSPNAPEPRLIRILKKWLLPKSAKVICQTKAAEKILSARFQLKNTCVIGNPISQLTSHKNNRENVVLCLGRLIETKHQKELIELWSRLKNRNEWKLVIAGGDIAGGHRLELLKKLVVKLKLEQSVSLLGAVSDVPNLLSKSKIFAFPSSSEGFPNALGEAMSAGLAPVAFDCVAGPSDLIENGKSGFLVPVMDFTSFGEKLSILMQDEDLRENMAQNAIMSAERFERGKIAKQFLVTFSLISPKPAE